MQKRFTVLRIVSVIYKILGVVILLMGLLSLIGFPAVFGSQNFWRGSGLDNIPNVIGTVGGLAVGLAGFVGMLLAAVFTYSFGELISLLIAIEENTRASVLLLQTPKE